MKLSDLFASKAHSKVLQFLLEHPGKAFSLRYLARATGVAPSTVGIVVNNLEKHGLVYQQRLRVVKMIMLNPQHPVTEGLLQLLQRIQSISDE
ncbi:MAG: MarR family transcriptional regulator [Candidatus Caldarchaeum sp.]|nr:MarR family transcriptional regulator [Candidatus Caldarchaeum sp.]